jgi:ATP-dependent Clp protease, protease subunit
VNKQGLIISYAFKPQASAPNAIDVEIDDVIGESYDWWTDTVTGISYNKFKEEWSNAIENFERINIRINSVGGQVDIGNAMYNLMTKTSADKNKEIHTYNDGVAYSMASILMQVAPKGNRHAAKNSLYMIHSAHTSVFEWAMNATQMREMADIMDKYDSSLASALADNLGITTEEVMSKYFNGKDHYFTAQEAKDAGLIDTVENYKSLEYTVAKDVTKARQDYFKVAASKMNPTTTADNNVVSKIENLFKKYFSSDNKQTIMADLKTISAKFAGANGAGLTLTAEEVAAFSAELTKYTEAKYTEADVTAKVKAKEEELNKTIEEKDTKIGELEETIKQATPPPGGAGEDGGEGAENKGYIPMASFTKGI